MFENAYYADIRSTKEIRELYASSSYMKKTGIEAIEPQSIVDIDYVIKKDYKTTFAGTPKFDYAVLSHVVEHMPDILFFFEDIENILTDDGRVILIYPDQRYCFDHYRAEVSFRDAYATYTEGVKDNARLAFDFTLNVVKENNASFFWNEKDLTRVIGTNNMGPAEEAYRQARAGKMLDDVHNWPFSDYGFLRFMYEGQRSGLIRFEIEKFEPTKYGEQEFLVILKRVPKGKKMKAFPLELIDQADPVIKMTRLQDRITEIEIELARSKAELMEWKAK
jgi:SAM-dependent methyltransferase